MSWLTTTIGHARALRDKTKGAVAQARAKLGGHPGAAEWEKQLEEAAKKTKSLPELEEMHRSWARQLDAAKNLRTPAHGEGHEQRTLNFRQVLLQSRAVEISLETIAKDPSLRRHYAHIPGAPANSCIQPLHDVLNHVLDCPQPVWSEMLRTAISDADLLGEEHADWLVSILSLLKADWRQEVHQADMRDLASHIERLLVRLQQLGTWDGIEQGDQRHQQRIETSAEMVRTYADIYQSAEDAEHQQARQADSRDQALNRIFEETSAYAGTVQQSSSGLGEKHRQLQNELQQSHDSMQLDMQRMDDERAAIDETIEKLEMQKKQLKEHLDRMCQQVQEAQNDQRRHMELCDSRQNELSAIESQFKLAIKTEDGIIHETEQQQEVVQCIQGVADEVEAVIGQALTLQMEELGKKQVQFDVHFKEILKEHLRYEQEQLAFVRTEAENCATTVMQHRAKIDMLSVMDMSAKSVVDASERHRLLKTIETFDTAQQSFEAFRSSYTEVFRNTELETVLVTMEHGYRETHDILQPCRWLLSQVDANGRVKPGTNASEPIVTAPSAVPSADLGGPQPKQPSHVQDQCSVANLRSWCDRQDSKNPLVQAPASRKVHQLPLQSPAAYPSPAQSQPLSVPLPPGPPPHSVDGGVTSPASGVATGLPATPLARGMSK